LAEGPLPPIVVHLVIAKKAAAHLRHPVVDHHLGSYLLGSSAPDMRIITGASREELHFLGLDCQPGESGVDGLLEAQPRLRREAGPAPATQAFIAGYFSHLVTDEIWIVDIYRPFFGKTSPLGDDPMAAILDRMLQFELDRRERANREYMHQMQAELLHAEEGVDAGFIEPGLLKQWREFVTLATGREANWERFRIFAQRFLIPAQKVDEEQVERLLANLPEALEGVIKLVTPERLDAFRSKAIEATVEVARGYLN